MAKRLQKKKKQPPLLLLLKILYWAVFSLSLVIVCGFLALKLIARPPKIEAAAPTVPVQTAAPSAQPPQPGQPEEPTSSEEPEPEPAVELQRKEDCHTFLLLGTDDGNGNTDTIMAVTYDVKNQQVTVASIPRDTLVDVPRTIKKINAAYANGGVKEIQREVSQVLGYPVDHYIIINLRGFRALVDQLGGVDFYVPVQMDYDDPTQNLHIHLNKGTQHLDGAKALQLVRFRSGYQNADLGRIQTQQKFLTALAKKLLSFKSVTKINDFVEIFAKYVKTDLSVGNLAYFGMAALELDTAEGLHIYTLPGNGETTYRGIPYYYQLEPRGTLNIINSGLNPYTEDVTLDMTHIFQVKK